MNGSQRRGHGGDRGTRIYLAKSDGGQGLQGLSFITSLRLFPRPQVDIWVKWRQVLLAVRGGSSGLTASLFMSLGKKGLRPHVDSQESAPVSPSTSPLQHSGLRLGHRRLCHRFTNPSVCCVLSVRSNRSTDLHHVQRSWKEELLVCLSLPQGFSFSGFWGVSPCLLDGAGFECVS